MEERKEEYNRAREQIFNQPGAGKAKGKSSNNGKGAKEETDSDGASAGGDRRANPRADRKPKQKVAIFHDRDKDRLDPDFCRNMDR